MRHGRPPLPEFSLAPGEHAPGAGARVFQLEAFRIKRGRDDKAPAYGRYEMSDVHFHPTNYAHQGISFKDALGHMEKLRIYRTVMSPIPTRQLVQAGKGVYRPAEGRASCGCNYYIPDQRVRNSVHVSAEDYQEIVRESPPLAYDTECDTHTAANFEKLTPAEKDRFDCMVTGLILGDERCSESLLRKLSNHPGVFTGVGEITIHKEFVQDKLDPRVQADLRPHRRNTEALVHLIRTAGDIGMPMVIHCDADVVPAFRKAGAAAEYFDHARELFSRDECRNTTIIWAHAAGAGKYSHLRDDHVERVDQMLSDPSLAHVNVDISWDVVAHQLVQKDGQFNPAKAASWAALFEKHADRILFGSDSLAPMSHEAWGETAKAHQRLMGMVMPASREKIMKGNYERLIVAARPRVRSYERHCLSHAIRAISVRTDDPRFETVQRDAARRMLDARVAMELELARGNPGHERVVEALRKLADAVTSACADAPRDEAEAQGRAAASQALAMAQAEMRADGASTLLRSAL